MKKRLCIWLLCLATLCLTACGGGAPEAAQTESPDLLDTVRAAVAGDETPESDADAPEWDADAAQSETDTPEWESDAAQPDADAPEWESDTAWTDGDIEWTTVPDEPSPVPDELPEDGAYTSKEEVALYLHLYGRLPANFITKKQAQSLGWSGGSLEDYAPGKCIGGDRFGNYEKLLPTDRTYHECDINTLGARSRGAERLVYSDDGLIYYTADHYNTFTLLYGTT
ncbi:MAG: ribonuclease [Oscillibacter sp.]|nr:ribonuclease [Oscillibacter sp.]